MQEQLIQELVKLIQGSANFAIAQAPDVIQQVLMSYSFGAHLDMYAGIGALVVVLLIALFGILTDQDSFEFWFPASLFGGILLVVGFISTVEGFSTSYKIQHFPKAYLVEKLTHE